MRRQADAPPGRAAAATLGDAATRLQRWCWDPADAWGGVGGGGKRRRRCWEAPAGAVAAAWGGAGRGCKRRRRHGAAGASGGDVVGRHGPRGQAAAAACVGAPGAAAAAWDSGQASSMERLRVMVSRRTRSGRTDGRVAVAGEVDPGGAPVGFSNVFYFLFLL